MDDHAPRTVETSGARITLIGLALGFLTLLFLQALAVMLTTL